MLGRETIFALASARGKAGVAVLRISGPAAEDLFGSLIEKRVEPRVASLRSIRDPETGEELDQALVLFFPAPSSFTGETVVELHLHGSVAVVAAVMRVLGRQDGFRLAEPGEFTRRALENDRLDLTQVEGLADLIEAETEVQRKRAAHLLSGSLRDAAESWRRDLIRALALIEATIDFADEDVPVDVSPEVDLLLSRVDEGLKRERSGFDVAERILDGFEVAIVGRPNAGKSTLLNALAGREAAITSEVAGTTRDVIEVRLDIAGLPVTLLDTAGLRESDDHVESIGVRRAEQRAEAADLRVFLLEPGQSAADPQVEFVHGDIVVSGKADLGGGGVSGLTGQGLEGLVDQIGAALSDRVARAGSANRMRQVEAMGLASDRLVAAQGFLVAGPDLYDLTSEELRRAVRALDSLTGRIDVEHVLDEIFASFCLGK